MNRTIFNTPIIHSILYFLSRFYFRFTRWKMQGEWPKGVTKCVIIGVPHTSNWDLIYALLFSFYWRLHAHWMGKNTLFKAPFGGFMRWTGGVSVNRSVSHNTVENSIQIMNDSKIPFQYIIAPEGTRSKTSHWRTGFYYIAKGANVPIVLAYLDYKNKTIGIGKVLIPSDDAENDMNIIKEFYAPFRKKEDEIHIEIKNTNN